MDDKSELREALERLHAELEQTQTVDDESRRLLRHLQGDIQSVLREPDAETRASLQVRLGTALARFEESHPNLVLTIQQVLDHMAQV